DRRPRQPIAAHVAAFGAGRGVEARTFGLRCEIERGLAFGTNDAIEVAVAIELVDLAGVEDALAWRRAGFQAQRRRRFVAPIAPHHLQAAEDELTGRS